ncbi:MAG TPA: iron-containing alcohol dehydrogenase [Ignisphaera sp.]|nr:iron-containing alcohol dehydrogenase [Ignisphaera sp.]
MSLKKFVVRSGKALVYFGPNSVSAIEKWVRKYSRVFIVTGRRAARISGALDEITKILNTLDIKYEIFDGVVPNPTTALVDEVAEKIWRFGAEAVIGIGGGSAIDTAKIASIVSVCGGRARDYMKKLREPRSALPLAAVNLTHGTGTEADRYAVATIEETNEKVSIASDLIYPSISIDDPRYLRTLPKNQTIYTALDALYHAIESATSNASSPYTQLLAEQVTELVVKWLPIAIKNPDNLEARYWLLYASMLAGIAIDHGRTHLIHALEHALSGIRPELAHGAGLAILGPYIIKHIYKSLPEVMYRLLKHIDPSLEPIPEYAEKASESLKRFQKNVGFEDKLTNYGFKEEDFDKISRLVFESMKYLVDLTPFEVSRELLKEIYVKALLQE